MQVIKQIAGTGFFDEPARHDAYKAYRQHSREVLYAHYLCAKSRAEDQGFNNLSATFSAYAAAIDDTMPSSTIDLSVALRRDTKANGRQQHRCMAGVAGFVSALKSHMERPGAPPNGKEAATEAAWSGRHTRARELELRPHRVNNECHDVLRALCLAE